MNRASVILTLLVLVGSVFVGFAAAPTRATSGASFLHDDFTHDTTLNASLWQVNGPVGTVLGPDDAGFQQVALVPAFSSTGMEIAQVNKSQESGTIESVASFAPPFTAVAVVEGVVSNGHTFGFAIASAGASSGVLVYGNLNDTNCSHLGDCGDPAVCGSSANSAIPPNQCYYGIDAKVGKNATSWPHVAKLYLTPGVDVFYKLQVSVDASGSAQYSVSQGGLLLGQSTAQVGTGPFYLIMEQAEGSPVARPGPNQAYWSSVSLGPLVVTISTTTTSTSPGPTLPGATTDIWIIVVVIAAILFLIILLWYRSRNLTVTVQDSRTISPIQEANVSTDGKERLAGYTGKDGRITFKGVKKGEYVVKASAAGYAPSLPAKLKVEKTTEFVVRLDRTAPTTQEGTGGIAPPGPTLQPQQPPMEVVRPVQQHAAPSTAQPELSPRQPGQQEPELEGWGGERIREIIRTFQAKGAISPETALTAQELGLSRLFVRIMKRRQGRTRVFVEINGRYYLNQEALRETK